MLNIAFISHMYPSLTRPTYGRFIHEHVKSLQALGVAVRVISPVPWSPPGMGLLKRKWRDYEQTANESGFFDGVEIRHPTYFALPRPLHFLGGIGMAAGLRSSWDKLMTGFRCDLIHAHTITPDGFAACRLAKSLRLPVICSARGSEVHSTPKESAAFRAMTRRALRQCNGMIAVSRALACEAVALAGETLRPKVIYNGVSETFQSAGNRPAIRRKLNLPESGQIILFIGRCELDKGAGELLQAFAEFNRRNTNAQLVYVGDGSAREELHATARQQFGGRVHFIGQVGREEIHQYLQAADIFVLPSHGEGMPNALLEAMGAGLPCIATSVGGIPEAIQDCVNGLLIPSKSPAAIAAALEKITRSPELATRLGAAAARTVKDKFTWQANAAEHLKFYEETIARWTTKHQPTH